MLDRFSRIAFFFQSDCPRRMTIRIRRAEQKCTLANLDGTVEFAFFQQRTTETVPSKKVIGMCHYRLLVMSNRFVNPALLKKRIAQRNLSIRIAWSHANRLFTVKDRLLHLTFCKKRCTEIILGIPRVGLHLQRRP